MNASSHTPSAPSAPFAQKRVPAPGQSLAAGLRHALLAVCAAAALAGCFLDPKEEKTAGVDDFPNSIYARMDGFLDEGKKADGLEASPNPDSLLLRQSFNGPPAQKLAAGASASLPSLQKLAADTCKATFTFSEKKAPIGSRVTVDTLILCVDAAFLDTIKGNEHIVRGKSVTRDTVSGRVEIGEFSDADGDGFLNPILGGAAKARVQFIVTDKGVTERTVLVIEDGPDDNFDTEPDNLIYELSWSRTANGGADTLGSAAYRDADGDGVIIDNGKPSLADVAWYHKGPTQDDPDAAWSRIEMRSLIAYGVNGAKQNEMRRFSATSETKDGRRSSAVILGPGGGPDFGSKDTVEARFLSVGAAAADSVDTLETVIRMKLGNFDDKADDTTYALQVRVRKHLGEERLALFDFESSRPIAHGREPEAGELSMRVEYADGTALDVRGSITDETVDVIAVMRDGKRLHVIWDRTGKGISLERLD